MPTFSENQAMKPTDGGMISYQWPGLQLSLSVHKPETCCRRNQQRPAPKPAPGAGFGAGLCWFLLQHVSALCFSCRADMSAHSSANIYRNSGEDEETWKDCRWFEAESSEQTSWAQNQNSAVTTRLLLRLKAVSEALSCDHVTAAPCFSLSQHFVLFKRSRPARLCCDLQDGVRNSCWLNGERETSREDVTRWWNRKTN